jgi:hypothetical protein
MAVCSITTSARSGTATFDTAAGAAAFSLDTAGVEDGSSIAAVATRATSAAATAPATRGRVKRNPEDAGVCVTPSC